MKTSKALKGPLLLLCTLCLGLAPSMSLATEEGSGQRGSIYNLQSFGTGQAAPRGSAAGSAASPKSKKKGGIDLLLASSLLLPTIGDLFGGKSNSKPDLETASAPEVKESNGLSAGETSAPQGSTSSAQSRPPRSPMEGQAHWPERWQLAFLEHINNDKCGGKLRDFVSERDEEDGLAYICGGKDVVEGMTIAQKNLVKLALFENIAFEESGNKSWKRGEHSPSGDGRYPHGLFQLDAESMGYYHRNYGRSCCPITSDRRSTDPDSVYNPISSIQCAVTMANHLTKDGVYTKGISPNHETDPAKGVFGAYYQVIQDQDKEKQRNIYGKAAGFCDKLLKASANGNLAEVEGISAQVVAAAGGTDETQPTQRVIATDSESTSVRRQSRFKRAAIK